MIKAIRFYGTPRKEKSLANVYDFPKKDFMNWVKTGPSKTIEWRQRMDQEGEEQLGNTEPQYIS